MSLNSLFLLYLNKHTSFFWLLFNEWYKFKWSCGSKLIIHFSLHVKLSLWMLLLISLKALLGWIDLLQLIKELLSMWSDLRSCSSFDILFYFFPVFAILYDSLIRHLLPYMNLWCYSLVHLPDCCFLSCSALSSRISYIFDTIINIELLPKSSK